MPRASDHQSLTKLNRLLTLADYPIRQQPIHLIEQRMMYLRSYRARPRGARNRSDKQHGVLRATLQHALWRDVERIMHQQIRDEMVIQCAGRFNHDLSSRDNIHICFPRAALRTR